MSKQRFIKTFPAALILRAGSCCVFVEFRRLVVHFCIFAVILAELPESLSLLREIVVVYYQVIDCFTGVIFVAKLAVFHCHAAESVGSLVRIGKGLSVLAHCRNRCDYLLVAGYRSFVFIGIAEVDSRVVYILN